MSRRSLCSLKPGVWLNDEVIHSYLALLLTRDKQLSQLTPGRRLSHCFSSFFMTKLLNMRHESEDLRNTFDYANVRRWSSQIPGQDIFGLHHLIAPINVDSSHWTCVAVNFLTRTISYHNSMSDPGDECIQAMFRYLQCEHEQLYQRHLPQDWTLLPNNPNTQPQQTNNTDCGVFCCANVDLLLQGLPFQYSQTDVCAYRYHIARSILQGSVPLR